MKAILIEPLAYTDSDRLVVLNHYYAKVALDSVLNGGGPTLAGSTTFINTLGTSPRATTGTRTPAPAPATGESNPAPKY